MKSENLHGLLCVAAYWRVWVEWSMDPEDIKLAMLVRRGGLPQRVANQLVREGYVVLGGGPEIIGGGRAHLITDKGHEILNKNQLTKILHPATVRTP